MGKFYEFNQNNSGGSFDVDDKVCHRVVVEADDPNEANHIAEDIGIYFDGCDNGMDCHCYGDRWYPADDYDGDTFPKEYGDVTYNTIEEYYQMICNKHGWTKPDARIYYKTGEIKELFTKE